jgi:hypothetical protein
MTADAKVVCGWQYLAFGYKKCVREVFGKLLGVKTGKTGCTKKYLNSSRYQIILAGEF